MTVIRLFLYILTAALMLFIAACSDIAGEQDTPIAQQNNAYITLSVDIADPSSPKSRADFEKPASPDELIRTMRFIVVRTNGTVEYNILLTADNVTEISTNPLLVIPNEEKTVYLIGNEESLHETLLTSIRSLTRGGSFNNELITSTIDLPEGGPLYSADQPIPMTEIHRIKIKGAPKQNEDKGTQKNPYTYNLFVTRTAVKFTFNLTVTDVEKYSPTEYEVTDITFNSIGNSEYLFPTNTTYTPVKPETAIPDGGLSDYDQNREITSYSVPDGATHTPYTFKWSEGTKENGNMKYTSGPVYLPETLLSPDGSVPYSITLPFCGLTFKSDLTDLPIKNGLARNTHVIIDVTINNATLEVMVDVVPYAEIVLNPSFGFDEPNNKIPSPDAPPWTTITPEG